MNTETNTTNATASFETVDCSRCGGCGEYSYCPAYGKTCFQCQGTGKSYTKRGAAAKKMFDESCTKVASALIVGDLVKIPFGKGFTAVTEIKPSDAAPGYAQHGCLQVQCNAYSFFIRPEDSIRVGQNAEEKAAKKAAALAYQATLTKAGTPKKR